MKLSRVLATGAAAALIGVSTLTVGGSASAATTYVSDIGASTTWSVTGTGTATDSSSGLVLAGGAPFVGISSATTGADLSDFEDGLWGNIDVAFFQIELDFNGGAAGGETTLTADIAGVAGLDNAATWTTSDPFEGLLAGSSQTIADYEAALLQAPALLTYGVTVPTAVTATVVHIQVNFGADASWFLPAAPTASATPATVTVADASDAAKGVTASFTGFVPFESIGLQLYDPNASGSTPPGVVTADANGAFSYRYVSSASPVLGTYSLIVSGDSGVETFIAFTITANPAQLAATGTDFTPAIITGGVLVLLGAGLVIAGRRRAAAHRN